MTRRVKACAQCGRDCEEWALLCRECEGAIRINAPPPPPPPPERERPSPTPVYRFNHPKGCMCRDCKNYRYRWS